MIEDNDDLPPPDPIVNVVALGRVRKERGKCWHKRFQIDETAGAVYCADCEEEVPAFWVLKQIATEGSLWHAQYDARRKEMEALKTYRPFLRAVKTLEQLWRGKMLPVCPHCRKPVRAEDMAATGASYGRAHAEQTGACVPQPHGPDQKTETP